MPKDNKDNKTNAMRLLEKAGVAYEALYYEGEHFEDGAQVAAHLRLPPETVYKTLVTKGAPGRYFVFVIPVKAALDLKKAAKAAGEKSLDMLPLKDLLGVTGYIRGGCTALGMKKAYPVFIDVSAEALPKFYVSAGKRGCQLGLLPKDWAGITAAVFSPLTSQQ